MIDRKSMLPFILLFIANCHLFNGLQMYSCIWKLRINFVDVCILPPAYHLNYYYLPEFGIIDWMWMNGQVNCWIEYNWHTHTHTQSSNASLHLCINYNLLTWLFDWTRTHLHSYTPTHTKPDHTLPCQCCMIILFLLFWT